MKKATKIGIILGITISGLYAVDYSSANNSMIPKTSGEIDNYQAVLNIALAHKNEIFLSKINTLFNYVSDYVLKTGDIDVNNEKLKKYFSLETDELFKNFDGKNNIKILVDDTGIYFSNLFDSKPSNNELYFLQNAPNYPSLMKLYKDSNQKYVLYLPFNPKIVNFIQITKALQNNTLIVPDEYKNFIKNGVIAQDSSVVSTDKTWIKPVGDGTYEIYVYNKNEKKWIKTAIITNENTIIPISKSVIGTLSDNNMKLQDIYTVDSKDITNKIVIGKSLSDVPVNKLQNGTLVIINPNPDNKDSITITYIKIGDTLQPITKETPIMDSKTIHQKMIQNYLKYNSSIYVTFTKDNFDESTKSFIPEGNLAFGNFITKNITFRKDPQTQQEFAFLSGNANSYIRSYDGAKIFGYIEKMQHTNNGATLTIIVPFKNATPDIKDPLTGKPLYDGKVRQVPFGVSGLHIGLYYAWGNMCYNCYSADYRYMGKVAMGTNVTKDLPITEYKPDTCISKSTDWMIAVWKFKPIGAITSNEFELFKVKNGNFIKVFDIHDSSWYNRIKGKKKYNPSVDYLAFGGGMSAFSLYDGSGGGFDAYSGEVIRDGDGAGFRGWVGGITIVPTVLDDNRIIDIIKYQIPGLVKE